jgi:hypothetical protein
MSWIGDCCCDYTANAGASQQRGLEYWVLGMDLQYLRQNEVSVVNTFAKMGFP